MSLNSCTVGWSVPTIEPLSCDRELCARYHSDVRKPKITHSLSLNPQKLLYRASYRGTAEMDFLIGGFAKAQLGALSTGLVQDFDALLKMPDPTLENLIWRKTQLEDGDKLAEILGLVQAFHGI